MATHQPNDPLEIRDWMTQFIDLLRELDVPKAKEDQVVVLVMKLATTFNVEWLRNPTMTTTIIKSLGVDQKSETLRKRVVDAITRIREDREDVAAMEEAMKEPGPSVPWETVKKDLGI